MSWVSSWWHKNTGPTFECHGASFNDMGQKFWMSWLCPTVKVLSYALWKPRKRRIATQRGHIIFCWHHILLDALRESKHHEISHKVDIVPHNQPSIAPLLNNSLWTGCSAAWRWIQIPKQQTNKRIQSTEANARSSKQYYIKSGPKEIILLFSPRLR